MKLLALVDAPDHVCCRYRIGAFASALNAAGCDLHLQALARGVYGRLSQFTRARQFDSVILQRKLLPRWQVRWLRRYARNLVFDFDDAVLYRDLYDRRGPVSLQRAARFAEIVTLADTVLAGNAFLAECAVRAGAPAARVRVVPTCIDIDRYAAPTPEESPVRPGLDLVWIGSSSTLKGLEQQRPLWQRIAREVPGVRLRLICDRFAAFDPMPVVPVPWSESTEAASLTDGDVGISWIPDDLWSRGKCGLKVLQYQASGLPVLANPVGVHPEMIRQGVTGWLAESQEDWVAGVAALAADPMLRQSMGKAARSSVASHYSVAAWSDRFVEAVTGGCRPQDVEPETRGRRPGSLSPSRTGDSPHDARPLARVGNGTGKVETS